MPNVSIPLLDTSGEPIKGFNQDDHPQASICKNKSHNVAPKICLCGTASDTDIGIAKEELDPLCECKIYPIKILDLFHKCRTLKPERWNFSAETENALRKLKRKTRRRCVCFKAMGDDRGRESVSNADDKHPFQPQQALVDVHASYSSITFKRIWEDSGSMSDDTINDYLVNALNMTPSEVDHVKGFLAASSSRSLMDDSFVRFRMEQAILKQRFHTIFGDGYRNLEDFQNENGKLLRKLKVGFYRKLFTEPQMHMDDTDVTRKSVSQKGDIVSKQDRRKSRLAALEQKLKGDYIKKIKKKMERRAEEKRKLRKKRAIDEKLKKSQAAKEISVDELKITKLKKVANDLELSTVIDDSAWTVKVRKTSLEDEYEYIDDIVNRGRKSSEDPIVLPMLSLVKDVTPRGKRPKSNRSPRRQSIKAVSNEATLTAGLLNFQIKERLRSAKVYQTNEIIRSKKTHPESPETLVGTKPAHDVSRDLKDKIKLDKKKESAHACIATPAISFSKYENPKKKRKKLKKKTAVLLEENSKENKQAYVHAVSEISTCNNTADKILQMSPRQLPISQKPKMSVGDMLKQEIMQTGSSYGTRRKKLRRRLPRLSPLPLRPGSSYSEKTTDGSSSNPKSETFKDCPPPQNSCDSAKIQPKEEPSNVKSMLQSHQKQYVANVRARKKLQENVSFVYSTSSSANFELPELGVLLSSRPTSGSYETLYTRDKDFVAPNHQIEKLELLHDLVNKVLLPPNEDSKIRPFGPSSVPAKKNAPAKSKSSSKAKDWLKTLDQANDGSKDKKNVSVISGNREKDDAKLKSTTQDDILPPVKIKITITSGRVPFEGSDGLEVDRYYADVAKTILRKQYEDKYMKEGKKNSKLINDFNKRTLTAKEKANETLKEILKERKRRNNTSLSLNASMQSSIRRKLLNPE